MTAWEGEPSPLPRSLRAVSSGNRTGNSPQTSAPIRPIGDPARIRTGIPAESPPSDRPSRENEGKTLRRPAGNSFSPGATGRPFTKRRKSGKKIGEDSLLPIPVPPSGECSPILRKSLTFRPSGTPSGAPRNPEDCADRPTRRRSAFRPRECRESQWEPPAGQNDAHRWHHPSG